MFEVGDRVEYVGQDDDDLGLCEGHPGQVWGVNTVPSACVVSFVNGPSLDFSSTTELRALAFDDYLRRGRRLVALRHALRDRAVRPFMQRGHDWPEGSEPTG